MSSVIKFCIVLFINLDLCYLLAICYTSVCVILNQCSTCRCLCFSATFTLKFEHPSVVLIYFRLIYAFQLFI